MKVIKVILGTTLVIISLIGLFFLYSLYINPKSPLDYAEYNEGEKKISIRYFRPYKNQRLIFGNLNEDPLIPYGSYWRLGANLTTKITINRDLDFAGRFLPRGTYGLYTYPYAENWVIYLHTKTGGYSFNEPNSEGVVMKINIPIKPIDTIHEQFTIDFVESSIRMRWENIQALIPIN